MIDLHFDIETVPVADEALIQDLVERIKPPKTMTKADTIAKWEAEEKPSLIDDVISKTSLDGSYGRICCIGYAFDDGPIRSHIGRSEKKILEDFFADCEKVSTINDGKALRQDRLRAVGFNILDFDLRFVWQRAIINGVPLPKGINWQSRGYDDSVIDLMKVWNPSPDKRISMHRLCRVLGIPSPKENGVSGKDIALLWAQRKYKVIQDYCEDDVDKQRRIFKKIAA